MYFFFFFCKLWLTLRLKQCMPLVLVVIFSCKLKLIQPPFILDMLFILDVLSSKSVLALFI